MTRGVRRLGSESICQLRHYPSGSALQVPDVPASYKASNARIPNRHTDRLTWRWGRTQEVQELQSFDLQPYQIPSETRACSSLRWGCGRAEASHCERRERLMSMPDADVLIAGAGPTGLLLAGAVALWGEAG